MRELLRVENIRWGDWLDGYDLTINEGEIVYIQSLLDKSLDSLIDFLAGKQKPEEGQLYVHEIKVPLDEYDSAYAMQHGIYAVSLADEYMENMTIAENIMLMQPFWHLFFRKKTEEEIKEYFIREQISFASDTPMWMLGDIERKKLGLLKAKLLRTNLVMINIGGEVVDGKMGEELRNMIRKLHEEGMTFLILSCRYTILSELATRTQFLHQGTALKEWTIVPDSVREKLRYGNFFQMQGRRTETEKYFIGLYDYEWDLRYDFWEYLRCVRRDNPQFWEQYLSASIPDSGVSWRDGTAVIPRNSQNMLLENLDVGSNLTIAAAQRVTYSHTGIIKERMQRKVEEVFCKEQNLERTDIPVRNLSPLQKKILSIARMVILKPAVIILELPYQGIGLEEIPRLRAYLMQLAKKGIKIVHFSKTLENMREDCCIIIRTQNGVSAKIDTFS